MINKNDIPENKGKIVEIDGKKCCLFNDAGSIKAFSATCTHEEFTVQWNEAGNSFDCSLHGARYTVRGKVFQGPAEKNLNPVDIVIEGEEIKLKK